MEQQTEAVQRMQDYIAAHLFEEITLYDLAKAAMYSPWYAHKIFTALTGVCPSDYIRRLRLKESALRLRDEKTSITDVALDMGFGSVDGYTRAFAREFGCNPKEYTASPIPLPLFMPYGVKYRNNNNRSEKMQNSLKIFLQTVERPSRKVIIKRGKTATDYWTYCKEVGCDVWGILTSIKSPFGEPVCLWLPAKYVKPGTSEYVQGVEVPVNYDGAIPDGFDVIELPECEYVMFQSEPFEESDFGTMIEEVWDAEKKYDPSITGYEWDDDNPRIQLEPIGTRGYIELKPIKPLKR